jgi:biofilm PGA synthesis N-glycosyltransferase PgaC
MQLSKFKCFSDKLSADQKKIMFPFLAGLLLWVGYAALIGFYRRGWKRLAAPDLSSGSPRPRITVLVPARNEAGRLPQLLAALAAQDYGEENFEVLVIDDHSTDGTAAIAGSYAAPVRVHALALEMAGKKAAIAAGVEQARGSLIVTTDADCLPGSRWLSLLAATNAKQQSAFIAAPVRYRDPRGLCDIFQTLDFMTLQGITAASVTTGFHSMCNGANLAYEKTAFEAVDGFAGIDHLASGDDLLLMHKIAVRYPGRVHYLLHRDAIVDTDPAPGWRAFWKQRVRWASKSAHYDDRRIFWALLGVYGFNVFLLGLLLACFFLPSLWLSWIILIFLKTIVEIRFLLPVARFFGQQDLLKWFFLLQPLHITYTVAVGLLSQFGNYEWKGRKVK